MGQEQELIAQVEQVKGQMGITYYLFDRTCDLDVLDAYEKLWEKYAGLLTKLKGYNLALVVSLGRQALAEAHLLIESDGDLARIRLLFDQATAALGEAIDWRARKPFCDLVNLAVQQGCSWCEYNVFYDYLSACAHARHFHKEQCQVMGLCPIRA